MLRHAMNIYFETKAMNCDTVRAVHRQAVIEESDL